MAVMTILALVTTDVNWASGSALEPGEKFTAVTQLLTAIGIGWGITWIPYASDYSRFVRVNVSSRAVFWSSTLGMYVPTVWLAALGACLASAGSGSDPSALVVSTFGVMAVPVLLLLVHGPIATNILNLYSCSLAALSIGVRAARWKITLVGGTGRLGGACGVRQSRQLRAGVRPLDGLDPGLDQPMGRDHARRLLRDPARCAGRRRALRARRRVGVSEVQCAGLVSLAAGIVAGWSWQYGLVPVMQGPVATALGNTDFSWFSGSVVAGGLYWVLSRSAR